MYYVTEKNEIFTSPCITSWEYHKMYQTAKVPPSAGNFGHQGKKPFYSRGHIRLTKNFVRPTPWYLPHILNTKNSPFKLALIFKF